MADSILIYAEYLRNINLISVSFDVPLAHPPELALDISVAIEEGGRVFSVSTAGKQWSLGLPVPTVAHRLPLNQQTPSQHTLSYRLPAETPTTAGKPQHSSLSAENEVPLCALELERRKVRISCRNCDSAIIHPGTIKSWKNLPSQSWAEMMDFWHCHKPTTTIAQGNDENSGPLAIGARFSGFSGDIGYLGRPSIGLVDLMYFIVSSRDCSSITAQDFAVENTGHQMRDVSCSNCFALVGAADAQPPLETVRISKWSVRVEVDGKAQEYSPECFISAQMLSVISGQAIRRFLLTSAKEGASLDTLKIWVFNPDITYCSTFDRRVSKGMKILYQVVARDSIVDHDIKDYEKIILGNDAYECIRSALVSSTASLPTSMRRINEWQVGNLERFASPQNR